MLMPMSRLTIEQLLHPAGTGSSQPWVARASDGARYVVKFRGAGPGTYALTAEYVVNTLAVQWGYPVPDTRPMWLDAATPRVGTDEFWDVLDASAGWNLGVRWLPDAHNVALDAGADMPPDMPPDVLAAMCVLDRLFANFDRTAISNNVIRDAASALWLIDHGSCRFLRATPEPPDTFELASNHFLRAVPTPFNAPPAIGEAELAAALAPLPQTWLASLSLSREPFIAGLARRIAAFIDSCESGETRAGS